MIDKRLLVDSVKIQKLQEKDKWGKEVYEKPLLLSPVRFDRVFSHEGTGNHRSESKSSVLLVYPRYCPVVLDQTYLGGRVLADGQEYLIRKVIPQYQPFTKKILCYEVEVV